MPRTYEEDCAFINRLSPVKFQVKMGFVPNMNVEGRFYVNKALEKLMFDELKLSAGTGGVGGFLPAVRQIANVAALPGIVGYSIGLPDIHSGYGFSIGNIAAFDVANKESMGMDWTLREGYSWAEDKEHCEEYGRMLQADLYIFINKFHYIRFKHIISKPSRGLGHQVATDALVQMEKAMARDNLIVNDRQLACARIYSLEGNDFNEVYGIFIYSFYEFLGRKSYVKGRALSRAKSRRNISWNNVINDLSEKGISIRIASPKLIMEEAPESYKNVTDVVDTCDIAGISKKAIKLRPIAVIKG
uniref:3'-phosphate/5'-hydroxy nucleic acid ligase n=1 Tax=Heterorhabditis bacteriophora TaxID=37862 RepID=A0A1I7XN14_HETBA